MTLVSTDLISHSLPFPTQQLKPISNSHNGSSVSCFKHESKDGSSKPRNKQKVRFSAAETRPTHLLSSACKVTHFMKLLNRSCKAGKYNEAFYFLECMVGKGYKPDVVLCTKMIKGFFNGRNVEKATRVMEILEKYGEPDVFAYNALISGFCKLNRLDFANRVLDRMRSRGFSPDVVIYNIMIGSLCSRGRLDSAYKVMNQMLKDNCKPSVVTYAILIEAHMLQGGINEAMNLLDEML